GGGDDEVMEIPNPNAAARQAQALGVQGLPLGMTREQYDIFTHMTPEKRQEALKIKQDRQAQALKKAQLGLAGANAAVGRPSQAPPANRAQPAMPAQGTAATATALDRARVAQRVHALYAEVERQTPKGPPVELDAEGLRQAQEKLRHLWRPMQRMQASFGPAAQFPGFETKLMSAMKASILLKQNVVDELATVNGYLSLGVQGLLGLEGMMHAYFRELKVANERFEAEKARALQAQGGQQQQTQQQQARSGGPAGVAAGKAQEAGGQQQVPTATGVGGQGHARSKSNAKPPPAPTEAKTFDWGSPGNPHGVPKYDIPPGGRKELTPDTLKFPPSKKRRTAAGMQQPESADSTPAAQMGTPGVLAPLPSPGIPGVRGASGGGKMAQVPGGPAMKTAEEQQLRKVVRCADPACERSVQGFEDETQLRRHETEEHAPVVDPLAFVLDQAARALGVDQEGKALPGVQAEAVKMGSRATPLPAPAGKLGMMKRDGRTPSVKPGSTTPSGPKAQGKLSTASTKATSDSPPAAEKSLKEMLEARITFVHVPATKPAAAPPADAPAHPIDDFDFGELLRDSPTDRAHDDHYPLSPTEDLMSITDWGLPEDAPPLSSPGSELTPPSSDASGRSSSDIGQSERLRINFEWDAFGNGDTLVPAVLKMRTLELASPGSNQGKASGGGGSGGGGGEDAEMVDADANADADVSGESGEAGKDGAKGAGAEWDWNGDERADWETLFGAHAGLEGLEGFDFRG
ncbi:hypothetical protein LTR53_005459, partial [Teratosphaeriaceae sp. CCFEE 6253]